VTKYFEIRLYNWTNSVFVKHILIICWLKGRGEVDSLKREESSRNKTQEKQGAPERVEESERTRRTTTKQAERTSMFLVAFDVGGLSFVQTVQTGAISAQALSGVNAAAAQTVSLDDGNMYTDSAAPNNCVGVCDSEPFTGSPWVVPAPSHWYAAPVGSEGVLAPSQALASLVPLHTEFPRAVFGPQPKPAPEVEPVLGPLPRPATMPLGFISLHAAPGKDSVFAALEQVWNKKEEPNEKMNAELQAVRPTPGHFVMCGNALMLGAASSLWSWGSKTIKGEETSSSSFTEEFKESASCNAEAVTPIGGHWFRHHVLKHEQVQVAF